MREPVMKGIVQELYHQHNKYCRSSMTIKMKEEYRWGAQHTAVLFLGSLQKQSQSLVEVARLIWRSAIKR